MKLIENQNIEYKESWRDEYLKWVCGFANAQGGTIYIGVDDNGNIVGVKDAKKLMEDIPNKIQSGVGIVSEVNLLTGDGKDYIEIRVEPSRYPVNYHGEYHYRSGSTKQQLQGMCRLESNPESSKNCQNCKEQNKNKVLIMCFSQRNQDHTG